VLHASTGSFDSFNRARFCAKTESGSVGIRNSLAFSSTYEYPAEARILLFEIPVEIPILPRKIPEAVINRDASSGLKQRAAPARAENFMKLRLDDFIRLKIIRM
jgi:hypothetical protein